jgi:putative ABC transport system substrate-binding protein
VEVPRGLEPSVRSGAISRRQFVVGAAGAGLFAGCGRLPWQAEPEPVKVPQIGVLAPGAREERAPLVQAFLQGLHAHGYVEDQNIIIVYRFSEGHDERLPDLAAELVGRPVDIVVTAGQTATSATRRATDTIPIVQMAGGGDLVEAGLIASLAHPGGNVTGLTSMVPQVTGKRLELLTTTVPGVSRVTVVWDAANPANAPTSNEMQKAAQVLRVELQSMELRGPDGFEGAFGAATRERADALLVVSDPLTIGHRQGIVDLVTQSRLPAMYESREFVEAGGLMNYGVDPSALHRRAAYYVDRILKGAKPADLPVEQPMTFDFVVNMKTARELGITFPNEIMLQVTEVIE